MKQIILAIMFLFAVQASAQSYLLEHLSQIKYSNNTGFSIEFKTDTTFIMYDGTTPVVQDTFHIIIVRDNCYGLIFPKGRPAFIVYKKNALIYPSKVILYGRFFYPVEGNNQ